MNKTLVIQFLIASGALLFNISANHTNVDYTNNQVHTEKDAPQHIKEESQGDVDSVKLDKAEKELLARLVHAEAKGEPYAGKVAVANVVLNRMEHRQFPDTVREVIYQKNQFSPVQDGSIQNKPNQEAIKAVNEAIEIHRDGDGIEAIYFWNPDISTVEWMNTLDVIEVIGDHQFAI